MKTQTKLYLVILGLVVALTFATWQWIKKSRESAQWEHNYASVNEAFKTYINTSSGRIVSYQKALLLTEEQLREALEGDSINRVMADRYRKLAERITIKTEYIHDSILIPIPCPIAENIDTVIPYSDACLNVDFMFKNGFINMNSMIVPNQQDIVVGLRKSGLAKSYWSVDVHNSNPCIVITDLTSTHVVTKKRWWENPFITGTIGIAAGVIGWEVIR